MKLKLVGTILEFEVIPLIILERDIQNIFQGNSKPLSYIYKKALSDKRSRLYKIASKHYEQYLNFHSDSFGKFLFSLKAAGNLDYKWYLNKYGDKKYCTYKIDRFLNDKGIYCYILENKIMYVGRCRDTFKSRINRDYGKISPYNCLIDGQATNCHINSLINDIGGENKIFVGIYKMTNQTNEDIKSMEKRILQQHSFDWNIQTS